MDIIEVAAVVLAVAYLVLAIRENRWCWPAGTGSSLLYFSVFYRAGLYMESALQLFYVLIAVYGWWAWRPQRTAGMPLVVHRWPLHRHGMAVAVIALLTLGSGWLLGRYTAAAAPYLDSFVAWSAVLTTWMVARKLLENWLYWLVIDSVTLWLALDNGLHLTAALFAVYLVLVVIGLRTWQGSLQRARAEDA